MNNNWQPRIGQKVVALKDSYSWKKGQEFTVLDVKKPCQHWQIDIGIKMPYTSGVKCVHCNHQEVVLIGNPWFASAYLFTPLNEYPDATASIAAEFTDIERYDGEPVSVPREVIS